MCLSPGLGVVNGTNIRQMSSCLNRWFLWVCYSHPQIALSPADHLQIESSLTEVLSEQCQVHWWLRQGGREFVLYLPPPSAFSLAHWTMVFLPHLSRSPVLLASSSSSLAMVPGHSSVLLTPFCRDVSVPNGCLVGMDIGMFLPFCLVLANFKSISLVLLPWLIQSPKLGLELQ